MGDQKSKVGSRTADLATQHRPDALWVVRLPSFVEELGLSKPGADLPVAKPVASLGVRPSQPLGFRYDVGKKLGVRLTPLALPSFFANALAGVAQLGDQSGLLILGEGSRDLAHHLSRRVIARRQIIASPLFAPPSADDFL
jgi:hypothetical protein